MDMSNHDHVCASSLAGGLDDAAMSLEACNAISNTLLMGSFLWETGPWVQDIFESVVTADKCCQQCNNVAGCELWVYCPAQEAKG